MQIFAAEKGRYMSSN